MPSLGLGGSLSKSGKIGSSVITAGRTLWAPFDSAAPLGTNQLGSWNLSDNWTTSGTSLSHTGTGSERAFSNNGTPGLVQGTIYEVSYSITEYTSGSVRADCGTGGQGTVRSAVGSYKEHLTCTTNSTFYVNNTGVGQFIGTIDNVSIKLVSSYTGQALEFDGVSDYITIPLTFMDAATAVSISLWFNTTESNSGMIAKYASTSVYAWWINVQGGKLTANINANRVATSDLTSTIDVNDGSWHYATLTWSYSSGLASLYLDGVLIDTDANTTETDLRNGSLNNTIGVQGYISSGTVTTQGAGWCDGLMSNVQIWDTVLTASDIAYAYNNPEKLALGNSGTSLTYSNLKLWYPMQDGDRGNQSFLLDGAGTGLGPELWVDGTSYATTDLNFHSQDAGNHTDCIIARDGSEHTIECVDSSGDTGSLAYISNRVNSGTEGSLSQAKQANCTNKITFKAKSNFANGYLRIAQDGSTLTIYSNGTHITGSGFRPGSEYVDYYAYFPADTSVSNTDSYIQSYSMTTGEKLYIKDISFKSINAKNHGTSVFYGDELLDEVADFTDAAWDDGAQIAFSGDNIVFTEDSGTTQVLKETNPFTVVAGRTYTIVLTISSFTDGRIIPKIGNANAGTWLVTAATHTVVITAANTAEFELSPHGSEGFDATVSAISVKETGFAKGWTDADAQPTMPQLGFQSYNQLAWFDGTADYVTIADDAAITPTTDGFTVSAWVYANDNVSIPIVLKGTDEADMEYVLYTHTNGKLIFRIGKDGTDGSYAGVISTGPALVKGSWQYIVGTWDGTENSSSGIYLYVNGEQQSTNTSSNSAQALVDGSDPLLIGKGAIGSDTVFINGSITEVSLWNTQLTLAKVQELYNYGEALDALTHSSATNLTGYWRNEGNTTWTDLKGSNNGTPTSITEHLTLPEGQNSRDTQGFLMNRVRSSGVNLPSGSDANFGKINTTPITLANGAASTISLWIKPRTFANNYVLGKSSTDHILLVSGSNIRFRADSSYVSLIANTAVVLDEWTHLAITKLADGKTNLFLNGIDQDTEATGDRAFDISFIGGTDVQAFRGTLDDVAIYNGTALSAAQVLRNYKAGKGRHRN